VLALDHDAVFKLMVQDGKRRFQALDDVDILHRSLIHVCVFLDGADQIRYSRHTALDFIEKGRDLDRSSDPDESSPGSNCIDYRKQGFKRLRLDAPSREVCGQLPQVVLPVTSK